MKRFTAGAGRAVPAAAVTLALSLGGVAHAQVLEEIIVTAQKREQSLQDVGVSVTAFTGDQIRELGFTNTVDIVQMTPGLQYTIPNAEGSQINLFLRGVGLNDFGDANENPVGAYFDEVYRGAMGGLHLQLFDMERVEVLRGPQGTLYGRNTTGGLVHFISKKPTDKWEGYAEVTGGAFDQVKSEGAIGGPITDRLMVRGSFATNNDSGYVENDFPGVGDFNETDSFAGRGQVLWQPIDDLEFLGKVHYSKNESTVGAWEHQTSIVTENGDNRRNVGPTENPFGTCPGCDLFGFVDPGDDKHEGRYDRDGEVAVIATGASGKITWNINDRLTLVNITAFDLTDRLQEEDTEASPQPFVNPTFGADTKQWTEELRLHGEHDDVPLSWVDGVSWVLGGYYFSQQVVAAYDLDLTNLGFVFFDANYDQDTESWAVFGQTEWRFTNQFSLILGARFTSEEKELNYENIDTTGLFALATAGIIPPEAFGLAVPPPISAVRPTPDHAFLFSKTSVGERAEHDNTNITGRAEIDYRPNDDWLLFASYSRGVKSAGFNVGFLDATFIFASNTEGSIPFGEETLNAYEAGFKASLLDGRVRVNATGFYYDYIDFQTFRFELLNAIIFNTDAEIFGGELEVQASPWEGWDFMFGLSLMDAEAEDIPAAGTGALRDRQMVAAPDVSINAVARYEWPFLGGTASVLGKLHWQDETFYDIQNYDNAREDGYVVGDVRVQWTSPTGRWQIAGFVNNVTDVDYITYTFDFAGPFGFNQEAYGKPRWFGGSVRFNWGG